MVVAPFRAYEWQKPAWKDNSPILLLSGGSGSGKSRLAAEKIIGYLKKYPNATGLVVRKERESMVNSTIIFLEREVIGGDHTITHREGKHRFEFSNGSMLAYGGMKDEKQREQIRSIGQKGGLDIVWVEEANKFTEEDFNELIARMRGRSAGWRQIILTTNPDAPKHWINQRLILGKEASYYFTVAEDNPLTDEEYLKALDSLTGVQYDRLRLGRWVQSEGVIYKDFVEQVHCVSEKSLMNPKDYKEIIAGADSNFPLPRACVIIGVTGSEYHVLDEYYQERAHASDLRDWLSNWAIKNGVYIKCYHDPSDPSAIETINKGSSVMCVKGDNAVQEGISEVSKQFAQNTIKINENCVNLINEIQGYVWAKNGEQPAKVEDHLCDSLRYGVFTQSKKNRPYVAYVSAT